MYTIEIDQQDMINSATLFFQYPFEDRKTISQLKQHADLSVLLNEIKCWDKFLKLN